MSRGGARNRSGPAPSEGSGRSDARGYSLTALPTEGYAGEIPKFPLLERRVYDVYFEDKKRVRNYDADASEIIRDRELSLWEWAWRTPQACAWSMQSEAWRLMTIAMWVRTFVICESDEATAADKSSLHRFADQIGMTTAGLAEMGWKVAVDETAGKRESSSEPTVKRERRLRPVADAQ